MPDTLETMLTRTGQTGPQAVPALGTFVQGVSTVIAAMTAVDVLAAPGAGMHLVITRVIAVNITTAQVATLMLADDTPTPLCPMGCKDPALDDGMSKIDFPNGLVCASNTAFTAELNVATGDCFVYAEGYSIAD